MLRSLVGSEMCIRDSIYSDRNVTYCLHSDGNVTYCLHSDGNVTYCLHSDGNVTYCLHSDGNVTYCLHSDGNVTYCLHSDCHDNPLVPLAGFHIFPTFLMSEFYTIAVLTALAILVKVRQQLLCPPAQARHNASSVFHL